MVISNEDESPVLVTSILEIDVLPVLTIITFSL